MFRNATIYLSEIIVVCKKINVPLKYIGYFGKACLPFIPSNSGMPNSCRKHSTVNDRSSSRRAKPDFFQFPWRRHPSRCRSKLGQNWSDVFIAVIVPEVKTIENKIS